MAFQEIGWDNGHSDPADYTFFYGNGNDNQLGIGFFVHQQIISAVKRVEMIRDGMQYITL
jgi:hypothetical protein